MSGPQKHPAIGNSSWETQQHKPPVLYENDIISTHLLVTKATTNQHVMV